MDEKLAKWAPQFFIAVEFVIVIMSMGNLTEFFYIYEQHSFLSGIVIGPIHAAIVIAVGLALVVDLVTLVFSFAAMNVYTATHRVRSIIIPAIFVVVMAVYSSYVNLEMAASIHPPEFAGEILILPTLTVNPFLVACLPFLNVLLTLVVPMIFQKKTVSTDEEHAATIRRIQQEAEIKEATARANGKVVAARVGGALQVAKSTGVGKQLMDKMGIEEPEAPDDETEEERNALPIVSDAPEFVSTKELVRIYNQFGRGKGKRITNERNIRSWALHGRVPATKRNNDWIYDLNALAQHPQFRTMVSRYRRDQEKKGQRALVSQPLPQGIVKLQPRQESQDRWGEPDNLVSFHRALETDRV